MCQPYLHVSNDFTSGALYAFPLQMFLLLPNRANTRSSFQALVLGQWAGNAVEHYKQSKYSKMPSTAHIQESDKQFKCTTSKSFFSKALQTMQILKDAVNDTFSRKCTTSKSLFQKHYKQSNNANIRTCRLILEKNANYANTQLTINQRPASFCLQNDKSAMAMLSITFG